MRPRLLLAAVGLSLLLAAPRVMPAGGYGMDLQAGLSVPLSPEGPNSFSQAYAPALQPALTLWAQLWDDWRLGLLGDTETYPHKVGVDAGLQVWRALFMTEWDAPTEEQGLRDHFLVHAGIGMGGAVLRTSALYQSRNWTSVSGTLGVGWELPLHPLASLLALADASILAGPGKADPIMTGSLSLALRLQVTDTWLKGGKP